MEQDGLAIRQKIRELKLEKSRLEYEIFMYEQQLYNYLLLSDQQALMQTNKTFTISDPVIREATPEQKEELNGIDLDSTTKLEPWPSLGDPDKLTITTGTIYNGDDCSQTINKNVTI